mmetsp:Transcript_26617/g.50581  ORF Transcript_26617/g.50581 Transcript_26617/m.50581 type:complete len:206 (-) Transcript_26617:3-620(-)
MCPPDGYSFFVGEGLRERCNVLRIGEPFQNGWLRERDVRQVEIDAAEGHKHRVRRHHLLGNTPLGGDDHAQPKRKHGHVFEVEDGFVAGQKLGQRARGRDSRTQTGARPCSSRTRRRNLDMHHFLERYAASVLLDFHRHLGGRSNVRIWHRGDALEGSHVWLVFNAQRSVSAQKHKKQTGRHRPGPRVFKCENCEAVYPNRTSMN